MLEYYKLMLVQAGEDSRRFKMQLKKALTDLEDPQEIESLREWFKNRSKLQDQVGTTS
jgi:hypothetical protein